MRIYGTISRRILVNFRADPAVVRKMTPQQFDLDLHQGYAMVGICFLSIRHANVVPLPWGHASDNAAHRIAIVHQGRHGVYIPRRDTGSRMNAAAGGRLFPGEHHLGTFRVDDRTNDVSISITNNGTNIARIHARSGAFASGSVFKTQEQASEFYQRGSIGSSLSLDGNRLDGLELSTYAWHVEAAHMQSVFSYLYNDEKIFPKGSIEFDNVLIMRDIKHAWKPLTPIHLLRDNGGAQHV